MNLFIYRPNKPKTLRLLRLPDLRFLEPERRLDPRRFLEPERRLDPRRFLEPERRLDPERRLEPRRLEPERRLEPRRFTTGDFLDFLPAPRERRPRRFPPFIRGAATGATILYSIYGEKKYFYLKL